MRIEMEHKEYDEEKVKRSIGNRIAKMVGIGIMVAIGFVIFVFIGGFVVQALWNWLLPSLFGLPEVTFWQALGLLTLSRILFGSMGRGGRGFGKHGGKGWRGGPKGPFRGHLTEEEKEHLKQSAGPTSAS
jgi:hypothetical protein